VKIKSLYRSFTVALLAVYLTGCGDSHSSGHEHDEHDHDHEEHGHKHAEEHVHGHEHEEGSVFKAGQGITLTETAAKQMGFTSAPVVTNEFHPELRFTAQVIRSGAAPMATAIVPSPLSAGLVPGATLSASTDEGTSLTARLLAIHTNAPTALGGNELLLTFTEPLRERVSLFMTLQLPSRMALAVPVSAVLQTYEGACVYAQNGEAWRHTPVQVGSHADGWIEILEGLPAGGVVATRAVEVLRLIELRAVKGGGHSH
jgi:hypothetical protein